MKEVICPHCGADITPAELLTKRETLVYNAICESFTLFGVSPTLSELAARMESDRKTMWDVVEALGAKGYVSLAGPRNGRRPSRYIQLIGKRFYDEISAVSQ